MKNNDHRHGTNAGYRIGCRCTECTYAHCDAIESWRDDAYGAINDLDDPRHGTLNGYTNYGCRDALCRLAMSSYGFAKRGITD